MKSDSNDRQQKMVFSSNNNKVNYLLYLPKNYNHNEKFPLVLFLHGSGERGKNLEKVKAHGPPRLIKEGEEFPFILVSPQCPQNKRWEVAELIALLDDIESRYLVDKSRVYATGLSMGGYGVWKLAAEHPDRIAAIIPVCGGGDFLNACSLKDMPIWAFHGANDKVVSVQESERMIRAIERCGGRPRLTIYPDTGHDSWTETYRNPDIYKWLLIHSISGRIIL